MDLTEFEYQGKLWVTMKDGNIKAFETGSNTNVKEQLFLCVKLQQTIAAK